MAVSLLTYANRAKVAEALTAGGYPVTRMTVNRWASGSEMPGIATRMVLELFGHEPDTTKEPPPEWARAMEQRLGERLDRNRQLIERLIPDEALVNADALIERLEERLRLRGEGPPEGSDEPAPGGAGSQVQGVGSPPDRSAGQ